MTKILHVSHSLPPEKSAGVEMYTVTLAQEQAKRGHTVAVIARGLRTDIPAGTVERQEQTGFEAIRVHFGPGHQQTFLRQRWDMDAFFEKFIREWKPNIIHFQHLWFHSLHYPQIAHNHDIATVLTLHDLWFSCPTIQRLDYEGKLCHRAPGLTCLPCVWTGQRTKILPRAKVAKMVEIPGVRTLFDFSGLTDDLTQWLADSQKCLNAIDRVISPSQFVADNLSENGLIIPHLTVTDYGISRPVDPLPPPSEKIIKFGVIATQPTKGGKIAVEAFRMLQESVPAHLYVYGSEPIVDPPANVTVKGRYLASDLEAVYGTFDVLLVPSLWFENAPLVIREAFARQRPVIASDLGGMAESVREGIDGLRFPVGDSAALAACIRRIVEEAGLLETLRAGIRPPKFLADHVLEIDQIYQQARRERSAV